ncbi:MAG: hypothetical protein H8E60_04780 [Candidatus Marinimicrobia bacterium]|nr:hypothetical protein [Candidatus Neomarinimicrobiota bacterium]
MEEKEIDQLHKLNNQDEAELKGEENAYIHDEVYCWGNWAMPKDAIGELDHHITMTGDDLVEFIDLKLFPYPEKIKIIQNKERF